MAAPKFDPSAIDEILGGTPVPAQTPTGPMSGAVDAMISGQGTPLRPDYENQPSAGDPPFKIARPSSGTFKTSSKPLPLGAQLKAVYASDPLTRVKIFAKARNQPLTDFRVWDGNVYRKTKSGEYEIEEPDTMTEQILVSMTNPAVVLGTLGSFAGTPVVGGALGAAGGEGIRKSVGGLAFNESQTATDNLYDVGVETLFSLGGGLTGKGVSKTATFFKSLGQDAKARALKLTGRDIAAGSLTPAEHARAAMLKRMAEDVGVDLKLHQLYDRRNLVNAWKYFKNYPETADAIEKFEQTLAKQSDDAVNKFAKTFGGPVETPYATGKKLIEASGAAKDRAWLARQEAAAPFYKTAFEEGKTVDIRPLVDWIDTELVEREAAPAANLKKIKELLIGKKNGLAVKQYREAIEKKYLPDPDITINAKNIEPPHGVRDIGNKQEIKSSMQKSGWIGRPILAAEGPNGTQALTGSHRIAAAKELGIDVPIIKIDQSALETYLEKKGMNLDDFIADRDFINKELPKIDKNAAKLFKAEVSIEDAKYAYKQKFGDQLTKRSLRGLDDVKKTFDKMLDSYGETGLGATEKYDLKLIKNQMLEIMKKASPAYKKALATHAEFSKPLENLRNGILGQISEMESAKETAGAVSKIFDYRSMPDKMLLKAARKEIETNNPEIWDNLTSSYIRDAWNMTKAAKDDNVLNAASAMYKKFYNNPAQREIMTEALGPKKTQAWENLLTVLKRASIGREKESMTQPLQEINERMTGAMGSKLYKAASNMKQAAVDWALKSWDEMLLSKHSAKILKAMSDPDALKAVKKIKALSPASKNSIAAFSEFTALMMNKIDWDKIKRDQETERIIEERFKNQSLQAEASGMQNIMTGGQ